MPARWFRVRATTRTCSCFCRRVPFTQWTGRRSNPRLLLFRQVLDRLSYQSVIVVVLPQRTKKPGVACDTGPG